MFRPQRLRLRLVLVVLLCLLLPSALLPPASAALRHTYQQRQEEQRPQQQHLPPQHEHSEHVASVTPPPASPPPPAQSASVSPSAPSAPAEAAAVESEGEGRRLRMEIDAEGNVQGLDMDAFTQAVDDAQQQLRQADVEERYRISNPHSTAAAHAAPVPTAPEAEDSASYDADGDEQRDSTSSPSASPAVSAPAETEEEPVDAGTGDEAADGEEAEEEDVTEVEDDEYQAIIDELIAQSDELLDSETASDAEISSAMSMLQQAASLGSAQAHNELGLAYLYGDLLPRDFALSHHHFLQAANAGNATAQHFLAFLYSMRLASPPVSYPDSDSSLSSSVSPLITPLSILYDYFAATSGNVGAKLSLGYRHLHGYGVPKSCETAASYYRDVAQQVVDELSLHPHHQLSTIDRAHLSEDSARTAHMEDSAEVLQYYQHSADSGNVDAQLTLGQLHYYGHRGLPHSPALAAKYFSLAAAAGDANAMTSLGQMHLNGMMMGEDEDEAEIGTETEDGNLTALHLFTQAAELGNAAAQTSLGLLYLHGSAVTPVNYSLAFQYFFAAHRRGHPEAQFRLGVMHFSGLGVKQDLQQAALFFSLSALSGHVRGLFNLAQMESFGLGIARDCEGGAHKLKAVAERGEWSEGLGIGHDWFLQGDVERSWVEYALAGYEGSEVGQSNAAWLIDSGNVQFWADGDGADAAGRKWEVAYGLWKQSAEQKNLDSWRRMGDYAYYQLINPNASIIAASEIAAPPSDASSSSAFADTSSSLSSSSSSSSASLSLAASHYAKAAASNAWASFDLGFMYHHGLGLPRDLHLAKRYYDQSLVLDSNAWAACNLALLQLWFDGQVDDWRDWWEGGSSRQGGAEQPQQKETARDGRGAKTERTAGGRAGAQAGSGGDGSSGGSVFSGALRRLFGAESLHWSWLDWYECAENVVLAAASVALAVCVYVRAQRM